MVSSLTFLNGLLSKQVKNSDKNILTIFIISLSLFLILKNHMNTTDTFEVIGGNVLKGELIPQGRRMKHCRSYVLHYLHQKLLESTICQIF